MANLTDVFSHDTPQVFADEAPANSTNIGRILDRGFDALDAVLRAKYGDRAGLPIGAANTGRGGSTLQQQQQQSSGIGIWLILALILIFVFFRR